MEEDLFPGLPGLKNIFVSPSESPLGAGPGGQFALLGPAASILGRKPLFLLGLLQLSNRHLRGPA
jgi:hypothetical protein